MRTMAERLAFARRAAGLSQRGLAKLAGLSNRHVGLIEESKVANVNARTAFALAKALGVAVAWLYEGQGKTPAERSIRSHVNRQLAATGTDGGGR